MTKSKKYDIIEKIIKERGNRNDMKLILLTDDDNPSFNELEEAIKDKKSLIVNSTKLDNEYSYLMETILGFSKSNYEILLIRFSGKKDILKKIGDESKEIIIPISCDKKNKFYIENPEYLFSKATAIEIKN